MGVKDLWFILSPVCGKKSLWELKDKIIAIDLSCWICESQNVDICYNNNMYLRNLFFRTSYMLLLGINPIFILEGKAPKLKYNTLKQRQNARSKVKTDENKQLGKRSRLDSLQKQCEELLNYMGITCFYSEGEAEEMCAILNKNGVVDGVITQDSDCFLYGAKTVYRNFNISSNGGTVDVYSMSSIEEKLSLGRNKLVALSLLCGCDYNENGISGVGKETALKYLSTVEESEILEKLSSWRRTTNENFDDISITKLERTIKQKSLLNPLFPFCEVQNEFLKNQQNVSDVSFSWKHPNIQEFVILVVQKLGWTADYAIEKFLPILARWHLLYDTQLTTILTLDYIVKKRNLRSVPSYEVKWKDFDCTTIEPMSILKLKYDFIINSFEQAKLEKKSKKISKKKTCNLKRVLHDMTDKMNNLTVELSLQTPKNSLDTELFETSITVSDFECSASDLLELSSIVESIISHQ